MVTVPCVFFQSILCLHVQTLSWAYLFPFSNVRGGMRSVILPLVPLPKPCVRDMAP